MVDREKERQLTSYMIDLAGGRKVSSFFCPTCNAITYETSHGLSNMFERLLYDLVKISIISSKALHGLVVYIFPLECQ